MEATIISNKQIVKDGEKLEFDYDDYIEYWTTQNNSSEVRIDLTHLENTRDNTKAKELIEEFKKDYDIDLESWFNEPYDYLIYW